MLVGQNGDMQQATSAGRLWDVLGGLDVRVLWYARDVLSAREWRHPRLTNNHWRLYHNSAEGARLIRLDGSGATELAASAIYLIPPGLEVGSDNDLPFVQTFIHFDLRENPLIVLRSLFSEAVRLPDDPALLASVGDLARRLARERHANPVLQCLTTGIVYMAFAAFLDTLGEDDLSRCGIAISSLDPVLPALRHIHDHLHEPIANGALAAACSLSEDHFIRVFREAVGMPPGRYVTRRRVALAAQRLLFTGDSIERISEQTGFRDRLYFTRVFARETGRPPAAYRKKRN